MFMTKQAPILHVTGCLNKTPYTRVDGYLTRNHMTPDFDWLRVLYVLRLLWGSHIRPWK